MRTLLITGCSVVFLAVSASWAQTPLGTVFTYQGQLKNSGSPAGGSFNMVFQLFDAMTSGNQVGPTLTFDNVGGNPPPISVTNGLFTVLLDFGVSPYSANQARWLEITVNGQTLSPRQPLTPAPFALNTRGINVSAAGNVGIGTENPAVKLHLSDLARAPEIRRNGDGSMANNEVWGANSLYQSGSTFLGRTYWNGDGNGRPDWTLDTRNVANALMVDGNSSNVGIGTVAPGNRLEVVAASNGDGIRVTGATAPLRSPAYQLYDATNQRGTLGLAEGADIFSTDALVGDIVLRSNTGKLLLQNGTGASAMAISGNSVGIGTVSPENTLHVFNGSAGSITGNSSAPLIVENNSNTYLNILAPDANEQGILFGTPTGGSAAGGIIYNSASTPDGLQFRVNGNSTKMVLDAAGQLGLGTLAPEQTLEVTGASPAVRVTGDDTNIARLEIRNSGSGSIPIPIGRLDFIRGTNPPISITANNIGGYVMKFEMPLGTAVATLSVNSGFSCMGNIVAQGTLVANGGLDVNGGLGATPAATINRQPDDGVIVSLRQGGFQEGTISVAGTTVSYNAFTGSHYAWIDQPPERGTLIAMTGVNRRLTGKSDHEIIYGILPAKTANDPACLGAYLGLQSPSQPFGVENPHLVMAVGNGEMWVVDGGSGDILPGDYLISSDETGCAMKDDAGRFAVGHIVARAAERVEWRHSPGGRPADRKRISVLFGNFVRGGQSAALEKRVASQDARLGELESQVRAMQSMIETIGDDKLKSASSGRTHSPDRSGS